LTLLTTIALTVVELIHSEIAATGTMETQVDVEAMTLTHGPQPPPAALVVEALKLIRLLSQNKLPLLMMIAPTEEVLIHSEMAATGMTQTQVDVEAMTLTHGLQVLLAALVEAVLLILGP
jgi:hypothetical protein